MSTPDVEKGAATIRPLAVPGMQQPNISAFTDVSLMGGETILRTLIAFLPFLYRGSASSGRVGKARS